MGSIISFVEQQNLIEMQILRGNTYPRFFKYLKKKPIYYTHFIAFNLCKL